MTSLPTLLIAVLMGTAAAAPVAVVVAHLGFDYAPALATGFASALLLTAASAWRAPHPRQALRRGLLVLSGEALGIPLASYLTGAALGYLQTGGSLSAIGVTGDGFGSNAFSSYSSILALIFGSPAFILYFLLQPAPHDF